MKKLALVLAVLMLAVACVVPAAAADPETKTISFGVRSDEETAYLDTDKTLSDEVDNPDDGNQRVGDEDKPTVYKFTTGKGVTAASVIIPVCHEFAVYASVDGENWTKIYDWEQYKSECDASDTDMLYYKTWGPITHELDLSSVVKADAETLYVKVAGITTDAGDDGTAYLYDAEHARSIALRYYNAQLNRLEQKKDDGSNWGDTDEHDEFTFDGKFTLKYTVASASGDSGESGETGKTDPPQTADFTAAFVAVAVVALGATVIVAKKKH